jgi:predicted MFS family arabinose efflux permease
MSGLLDTAFGYRSAFWLGVGVAAGALGFAVRYLPHDGAGAKPTRLDPMSTALMCISLSGVILTLSEGVHWGWTSAAVLIAGPASLLLMAIWVRRELRLTEPLVDFRMIGNRTVLTADLSTLLVSASMYLYLPIVVDVVQSPPDHGQGLGESVLVSGLVLLPMSTCTLLASLSLSRLARYTGVRAVLPIGSLAFALAMVFFAFAHSALWEAFVSMSVLGVGCGLTFAAMPRMIVSTVPAAATGHAMGLYQVLRGIGMATGSALCGVLIAAYTRPGDALPTVGGYRASLLSGAVLCVATAVISFVLPSRGAAADRPSTGRLVDEPVIANAAELGGLS